MNPLNKIRMWFIERRLQRVRKQIRGFTETILKKGNQMDAWNLFILGRAHEQGTGLPKDTFLAFRLYLASAKAGQPTGQLFTGLAYRIGTGTNVDPVAAEAWWKIAASLKEPGAEVLLGIQSDEGDSKADDATPTEFAGS
jgi:TPR repeat protein